MTDLIIIASFSLIEKYFPNLFKIEEIGKLMIDLLINQMFPLTFFSRCGRDNRPLLDTRQLCDFLL